MMRSVRVFAAVFSAGFGLVACGPTGDQDGAEETPMVAGEAVEQQLCEIGYWYCPTDPSGILYHYCLGGSKIRAKNECELECPAADCVSFEW